MPERLRTHSERNIAYAVTLAAILCAMLAVMMFTGNWPTRGNAYNSYTLQACAWLEGRLDLGQNYPALELAIYGGKYYVSFPPFPSYVMLPLALIFGRNTPDSIVALLVTVLGAAYALRLYRRLAGDGHGIFWVLFLYLGTGYIFIAMNGWVWFIAQTMCFTLSLMALYHALRGQGGLALSFWACAVGCRPMTLLYLPVLLALLWQAREPGTTLLTLVRTKWYWVVGPALLGGSYMLLNGLRFGNILEFGHSYLPEFSTEHPEGQFSFSYLGTNIERLLRLPAWNGDGEPLTFYAGDGMAFWLIDPMFFPLAFCWIQAFFREREGNLFHLVALPLLTAAYVFILCLHRTLGGWQFGNRYMLDILPWLFFGFARWKPDSERFMLANIPLLCFGAALNLIGSAAIYNFWIL